MFYRVDTWDTYTQRFTAQEGCRDRHLTAGQLKRALRLLRGMGYSASRGDPSVLVQQDYWPLAIIETRAANRQ